MEVAHTRGTRWYLPANGRTWLQVKARTSLGEALLEGPGPHEICVWRFTLHERELHGEDPIELQVRLAAGDTTHRVHWIAVKETSGAAPANDPAALSGIQDLKEPAADKAMSTPGAPGTERGR